MASAGTTVRAMTRLALGCGAGLCCAGQSLAGVPGAGAPGVPPSYGHDFVTIGAPGNRAVLESEGFYPVKVTGFPNLGAVNYEYRIGRTETTVRQWFDFVNVAWPFAQAQGFNTRGDPRFLGRYIEASSSIPSQPPSYYIPGPDPFGRHADEVAQSMSLRFAAWYVNWTHHGQPTTNITLDTFTTGAYDVNTLTRQPGARYWIPSLDEWTKAVYHDTNRYGPGQEGYWQYSGMSTIPLIGGPPGTPGAQTSAGGWHLPGTHGLPPDVGSYPQTLSAWGLLDTSGGVDEYTDTRSPGGSNWMVRGDDLNLVLTVYDRVDYLFRATALDVGSTGLRLASVVPAPGPCALAFFAFHRRGRRMT